MLTIPCLSFPPAIQVLPSSLVAALALTHCPCCPMGAPILQSSCLPLPIPGRCR